MTDRYEVVIVGAGPAGGTLAGLLAQAGWSVAVVEKATFPRRKVCGEFVSAASLPVLARLGLADAFAAEAGPEVRRVGLFAGNAQVSARMPAAEPGPAWGRALGRDRLDSMLLGRAAELGATVLQPCAVTDLAPTGDGWASTVRAPDGTVCTLWAPLVVAAHGSWERGTLPSSPHRLPNRPGDLFGFKFAFRGADLARDLMPLIVFPGGYGGMVEVDGGRVGLSCCVRRDHLAAVRLDHPGLRAGDAVLCHIRGSVRGVAAALHGARQDGDALSAGPIRPGIRPRASGGLLRVGNAAGEAHPIVAEGIAMAMESAVLLFERMQRREDALRSGHAAAAYPGLARGYGCAWLAAFGPRITAAAAFAQPAMRAPLGAAMREIVSFWPGALTIGAVLSGKTKRV